MYYILLLIIILIDQISDIILQLYNAQSFPPLSTHSDNPQDAHFIKECPETYEKRKFVTIVLNMLIICCYYCCMCRWRRSHKERQRDGEEKKQSVARKKKRRQGRTRKH